MWLAISCCNDPHRGNAAYRRVLWSVLAINAAMFLVEISAGLAAGSASLQADALDFLGDAANYAISLSVVGMALRYRATAALLKGSTMAAFGVWVHWNDFLACLARNTPPSLHHGGGWYRRVARQCSFIRAALGLSRGRCEHAFGLGLCLWGGERGGGGLDGKSGPGIRRTEIIGLGERKLFVGLVGG